MYYCSGYGSIFNEYGETKSEKEGAETRVFVSQQYPFWATNSCKEARAREKTGCCFLISSYLCTMRYAATKSLSREQVQHLIKNGKRVSADGFTLVYLPETDTGVVRFSVVVPKRLVKGAVLRNRVRRVVRDVVRSEDACRGDFLVICNRLAGTDKEIREGVALLLRNHFGFA